MSLATVAALALVLAASGPPAATGAADAAPPGAAGAAGPAATAPDTTDWTQDAGDYVRDPRRNRRLVERFGREPPEELPALVAMLLADARFRAGQSRAAARLLDRVLEEMPDARGTIARVMLTWVALSDGDLERLDTLTEPLAAFGPGAGQAALLVRELAASPAAPADAAAALERLSDSPSLVPAMRAVVGYAAALARLWAGDPDRAAARFDAVAREHDAAPLVDDARYGAAIARWQAGAQATALAELAELAGDDPERPAAAVTRARLLLGRDAVVRTGIATLRRVPLGPPETMAVTFFDADAAALARRALSELPGGEAAGYEPMAVVEAAAPAADDVVEPSTPADTGPDVATGGAVRPRPASRAPAARPSRSDGGWLVRVALALVLLGAAWAARRALRSRARG